MERVGKIETRLDELIEELDNGGNILGGLTRMNVSLSDFKKRKNCPCTPALPNRANNFSQKAFATEE